MATTLILPGLYGSGDSHWQRIWAADCPDCEVVEQENWACPDLLRWADVLERRLADTQDAVHLVAHSLGCLLVAHLAASPVASRIRSAFLVAPCDMEAVETLHPCTVSLSFSSPECSTIPQQGSAPVLPLPAFPDRPSSRKCPK